jgi:hypothetical protein
MNAFLSFRVSTKKQKKHSRLKLDQCYKNAFGSKNSEDLLVTSGSGLRRRPSVR